MIQSPSIILLWNFEIGLFKYSVEKNIWAYSYLLENTWLATFLAHLKWVIMLLTSKNYCNKENVQI